MSLEFLSKTPKILIAIALVFICVIGLIGLGVFLGSGIGNVDLVSAVLPASLQDTGGVLPEDTFAQQYKLFELTILFGIVITLLLCWTFYVLRQTQRNSKIIQKTNRDLQKEIEKGKTAENLLTEVHLELGQSSSKLKGIIEGTSDLISAIDCEYRIISFNSAYKKDLKKLFNVDVKNGMSLIDAMSIHPELQKRSKKLWDRALAGEQFTAHENFLDTSENPNYFEVTYNPIRNSKNKIIGASHIVRNITERKLAEEALKSERDFSSAIVEASNLLVMVTDSDGKIVKFNHACEETSGYKFDDIKGRVFWNVLIPSEEAAKVKFNLAKADSQQNYVNRWITKDEKLRLVSWRNSSIKDEDGNKFIISTGIDITEKAEFKETQNRILDILETSSDFIGISDMNGKINYLNRAGKEMLGIKNDDDLSSRPMISCYPKWAGDLVQGEGIPTAIKRNSWIGETALITSGGREVPVSQLILAHSNERGEIEYLSTVARDISKQKRLEKELAGTRDKAIETAKIKSAFLANMSHEIRTPMNGIIGLAELLLSTDLNKEQRDYVESVQNSGEVLLTIVNDILDFSKIEAEKFELEILNFDVRETVESILELFAEPAQRKEIELALKVDHDVPTYLQGDSRRLLQILTNFISNAVKFTENGEVIIRVKLENTGADKTTLRFSVTDTGIGVSEKSHESLFDAFTQADNSIARRYGGTGLGLAISKQLVELMGGEIGVDSELGRGSCFWFTAKFEAQESSYYQDTPENLEGARILIVDDNDSSRNILFHQAKSVGVLVEEASSGKQALNLLKIAAKNNEPFEVAVVDQNMPKMNGIELSQNIRNETSLRKTRIVLMPNVNNHKVVKNIKSLGIDSYIYKPIRQTDLYETLSKVLVSENEETKVVDNFEVGKQISDLKKTKELGVRANLKQDAKILVAEDNQVNQMVISGQLRKLGFDVDLRTNGKEVLSAVSENHYSLILMDCQMPVMDGLEAAAKIREKEGDTHVPIIAVTASTIENDIEQSLEAGMDDHLIKPIKQDELARVIEKWILKQPNSLTKQPLPKAAEDEFQHVDQRLRELADACGNDINLECIEVFMEDFDDSVGRLKDALKDGDGEAIDCEAHKLKGSSANMGAIRLPEICNNLMKLVRDDKVNETRALINEISNEYEMLKPIYQNQKQHYQNLVNEPQPTN